MKEATECRNAWSPHRGIPSASRIGQIERRAVRDGLAIESLGDPETLASFLERIRGHFRAEVEDVARPGNVPHAQELCAFRQRTAHAQSKPRFAHARQRAHEPRY
jgi:hypothetical protein